MHDLSQSTPFADFAAPISLQTPLRRAVTEAYRLDEAAAMAPLLDAASLDADQSQAIRQTAHRLVTHLRETQKGSGVEGLVQEYSLSSEEGVALMCLAEALLRIPDDATRDALIRDKIADGNWSTHLGGGKSLFVNAATWGLVVTGKLVGSVDDRGLGAALTRLVARAGEPVIRRGVDLAMRMMGEQFVTGETIDEALKRAKTMEQKGFRYSYDMLGEAAITAKDATGYFQEYEQAIHAIGTAAAGAGVYLGPGISIKLSALHPRYSRLQAERVMGELLPRVKFLALLAKRYDIGLNIDAEEADRLELSLDLLEGVALDPELAGWDGLGFVVQAYGKRCPFVIDWLIDLAKRSGHRIMVRLVKGAYWDAEIKRAQVDGLSDFPVYTRKVHTDVAYIACARKLLAATDYVFPQFATHNAQTLASIYHLAGPDFAVGKYEFQCLHGMGEPLYEQVVGKAGLDRPCRIYAPVGTHETLLAYLVRRLLENGANSSFVHRIADPSVSIDELTSDPVDIARAMPEVGGHHSLIKLPVDLFSDRANSAGIDLSDESVLASLGTMLRLSVDQQWIAQSNCVQGEARRVVNPADERDSVGTVFDVTAADVQLIAKRASRRGWTELTAHQRADVLDRASDLLQTKMPLLMGLIVREAGKTVPNAITEVREAIDFLRYYAQQAREGFGTAQTPLGTVTCISPWNFPLAIFLGQVSAALAAGNAVLAKPAEETPLIAAQAVAILQEAGVPDTALQLVPGDGSIGAALVEAEQTNAVIFTGSTEVARLIQKQLADRTSDKDRPIPLIAETGGQNAMIVDSSALAEQVVADVIMSAFDSAGQRCSALRVLCLQEDVADRILVMLKGAMAELYVGNPDRLSVDVGPVITRAAADGIQQHITEMIEQGATVSQPAALRGADFGHFVPPTLIELDDIGQLSREVFGPVLHVVRYKRKELVRVIDAINATGYGLTFGLHTRLDDMTAFVTSRVKAGNLYVNRNVIGAIVGVQPFGGRGLSGTGPKAGGPLYMGRLVDTPPVFPGRAAHLDSPVYEFAMWLEAQGEASAATVARRYAEMSPLGASFELAGPVGERNVYALHSRGTVLLFPDNLAGLFQQMAVTLATGNEGWVEGMALPVDLPEIIARKFMGAKENVGAALVEGSGARIRQVGRQLARLNGPIISLHAADPTQQLHYCCDWLLEEVSISINTTAAGGNASLMMIG